MTRKLLVVGTLAVFTAGMAGAAFAADRFAPPSQPVPYSRLNAYLKGAERQRAAILARGSDANTAASAGVNSSATMPATPATIPDTPAPPAAAPAPSPVNPPADVATPLTSPSPPAPR